MQESIIKNKPKYNFVLQNFEGPLDLLLYLISKNKMSIFDISLSTLTDEYISYLNQMTDENLEVTSEFIVMAATLLDIKARKLLPEITPKEDDEEVLTEQDIIAKIIEYKKYKEIADVIYTMYKEHFGSFSKSYEKIKFNKKTTYSGEKLDKNVLHDMYVDMLQRKINKINKKSSELNKIALYEKVTIKDKVNQIVSYLNENNNLVFNEMFNPVKCDNIEVVTAFLGVLELSRTKQVLLDQEELFSDINVKKNTDFDIKIDLSNMNE